MMEISLYNPEFSLIRHIFPVPTSVGLGRFYCNSNYIYLCMHYLVVLNDSSSFDNSLARERESNLNEYLEDDAAGYRIILSTKQTYNVFVESCHIAEKILLEWNFRIGNLDIVLAAFELLRCVARIRIEDIDERTRSEVLISIHEFIMPPHSEVSSLMYGTHTLISICPNYPRRFVAKGKCF